MASFNKNLKEVQSHLEKDETVEASVFGAYETKILGNDTVRTGVLVATDKRVCFYAKKMMGFDLESFPYSNISSIEYSKGLMGHSIKFFASGNSVKVKWINRGDIKEFVDIVKSRIGKKLETPAQKGDDTCEQLEKLSDLKERGILTQEEFDAKKT